MNQTQMVRSILSENKLARDSDSELEIQVLIRMGFNPTPRQIDIFKSTSLESIRRTRQKLQERGEFLPSPEVAKQRKLKSMIMQQNAPIARPERIERLVNEQPKPLPWGQ